MSEALEQKLVESIDTIATYVNSATGFAADQAPLVANEIVLWGIAGNAFMALFGFAVAFAVFKGIKWVHVENTFNREGLYFGIVPAALLAGGMVFVGIASALKAIVSPRLYILEKLSGLVSGS